MNATRVVSELSTVVALTVTLGLAVSPGALRAQDDEITIDRAAFPPLPAVPAESADQVRRLRRLVRRVNRCRATETGGDWGQGGREGFSFGPRGCSAWLLEVREAPLEARVHAIGLEYVYNAMRTWPPQSGARYYEQVWLQMLGMDRSARGPRAEDLHIHTVAYLLRALSVLTRDDRRHRINAQAVFETLRDFTFYPAVALTVEGRSFESELERRAAITETWMTWARGPHPDNLAELRAEGRARVAAILESSASGEALLDAVFIEWNAVRRVAHRASVCRRVLASPALIGADRRLLHQRCAYARLTNTEMRQLHREARRARRALEAAPAEP